MIRNWNSVLESEDKQRLARKRHFCRIGVYMECAGWEDEYLEIVESNCCSSYETRVNFCPMCGLASAIPAPK